MATLTLREVYEQYRDMKWPNIPRLTSLKERFDFIDNAWLAIRAAVLGAAVEEQPALRKVCQDAIAALESLPEDALGYANDGDKCQWPIRDEMVHNLRAAVEERCVWTRKRDHPSYPHPATFWRASCDNQLRSEPNPAWTHCPYCGREIERKELDEDSTVDSGRNSRADTGTERDGH